MATKALYYPHTEVTSLAVLKNALLLWDELDTIVPCRTYTSRRPSNRLMAEATELVVRRREPTHEERENAHLILSESLQSGELGSLLNASPHTWQNRQYLVYPDKFLDNTWRMLEARGMAHWDGPQGDYRVPPAVGFFMMSILADTCAGTQIHKVTDRTEAHAWLAKARAKTLGSQYFEGFDISEIAPNRDRLVSLTLDVMDARRIDLKKLVALRRREAAQPGSHFGAIRRRYAKALETHVQRVANEAQTIADVKELDRDFKVQLKDDLNDLKAELRESTLSTLFSKEIAIPVVAMAGCLAIPLLGITSAGAIGAAGIIPIVSAAKKNQAERRKALKSHLTSWLFLANQGTVSF